jgi:hypothetical protein
VTSTGRFALKVLMVLAVGTSLSSCVEWKHEPTLTEPSKRDLAGTYTVETISWRVSGKKVLRSASFHLSPDGRYRMSGIPRDFYSPMLPGPSGTFEIIDVYGIDFASRGNQGVRFVSKDKVRSCHCQGEPKPWGLMFTDFRTHGPLGDYLLLRRTTP